MTAFYLTLFALFAVIIFFYVKSVNDDFRKRSKEWIEKNAEKHTKEIRSAFMKIHAEHFGSSNDERNKN